MQTPRHSGLPQEASALLARAATELERGDAARAQPSLDHALALAPDHPEALRLAAIAALQQGHATDATALLNRALVVSPHDPLLHTNLGSALRASGDAQGALAAFERSCALAPGLAPAWYNLGKACRALQFHERALEALQRVLALAPAHAAARRMLGDTYKTMGQIDDALAAYRAAIAVDARDARAWWGIANLKTVRFDAADTEALRRLCAEADANGEERALGLFSLAHALEDAGDYAGAWSTLHEANAARRIRQPWDARASADWIDAVARAFEGPIDAPDGRLGEEIVFIVSLPRSGSTLVEQVLAAHPQVEGAGELPDLAAVLEAESARRGLAFPHWAGIATREDWARLGADYLHRTARWRTRRPRSTDKGLDNWMLVGAAAAMLPGARFVDCRRDRVETALANYRQWFSEGQRFSYDLADIVARIEAHARLMALWHRRWPARISLQALEALQQQPEAGIRALLERLDLPFAPECLAFHRNRRDVRSASAAQVREPMRRDTRRAHLYGELLDPLRARLAGI